MRCFKTNLLAELVVRISISFELDKPTRYLCSDIFIRFQHISDEAVVSSNYRLNPKLSLDHLKAACLLVAGTCKVVKR